MHRLLRFMLFGVLLLSILAFAGIASPVASAATTTVQIQHQGIPRGEHRNFGHQNYGHRNFERRNFEHQNYGHRNFEHQNYGHRNFERRNFGRQNYGHRNDVGGFHRGGGRD